MGRRLLLRGCQRLSGSFTVGGERPSPSCSAAWEDGVTLGLFPPLGLASPGGFTVATCLLTCVVPTCKAEAPCPCPGLVVLAQPACGGLRPLLENRESKLGPMEVLPACEMVGEGS